MGAGKIQRTVMSGMLPYFQDVLTGLTSPTAIVIVPTLPGDFNHDTRTVDAADYAVWRKKPRASEATRLATTHGAAHFGQSAGSGAASECDGS